MANDSSDYMKDILATPLGELISSIGNGVADAQTALDEASLAKTLEMYESGDDKLMELMRQIGYQPAFYAIPETEVEANVSLSMAANNTNSNSSGGANNRRVANRTRIYTTPTNATNSNRYNIQANASAKLKFKIVPVPPSNAASALRVSPNLVDKTATEVELILADFGLQYEVGDDSESGKVISQIPAAGEIMKEGDVLTLDF